MTARSTAWLCLITLALLTACDDDTADDPGTHPDLALDATPDPDATPADATPADPDASPDATPDPARTYATLVRGPLAPGAQDVHDAIAAAGQAAAIAAGDLSHDALLSANLLGTPPDQFLGLDTWSDAQAMAAFYADPAFAEALGPMFAGPPTVGAYAHQPHWHGWGALDAADDAAEYWFVIAAGPLAETGDAARQHHDRLAAGGEAAARAAGDVAHVVFLALDDPRQFLAIDVWREDEAMEAFYGNPDFQAAFAALFAAPPTLAVYHSTDWHQW